MYNEIVSEIMKSKNEDFFKVHPYESLFLANESDEKHFIADLGVYNKNRMMRIQDSTKFGKGRETSLRLISHQEHKTKNTEFDQFLFLNSLISNVSINDKTMCYLFSSLSLVDICDIEIYYI